MDAVKIYEDAVKRLEKSEITIGEFEKLIEPLRNVSEQKMEIYKLKFEHYIEDKDGRHDIEEPLVVQTIADLRLVNAPVTCQLNTLLDQMFDRLRHAALKR